MECRRCSAEESVMDSEVHDRNLGARPADSRPPSSDWTGSYISSTAQHKIYLGTFEVGLLGPLSTRRWHSDLERSRDRPCILDLRRAIHLLSREHAVMAAESSDTDGPPWYAMDSEGKILFEEIPQRLKSHPELKQRGITLTDPLKIGFVYDTYSLHRPRRVVKILNTQSEERAIYDLLSQHGLASTNHTVPCEITRTGHPLLIMPGLSVLPQLMPLSWSLYDTVQIFYQLVEGVEFLHNLHIAHLDLCRGNVLAATQDDAQHDRRLLAGKPAIVLPATQIDPPRGLSKFDPYPWDIHCLGHVLSDVLDLKYSSEQPWVLRRYVQWLIGDERGCTTVCRCRPTACHARELGHGSNRSNP
ncbi:hypothetical protein PYCCODRAFT_673575 [Trametes coccinea BRFM310]|uniref:Protein kinase domain-containing protein n=1 Tax=Trametes coccinea (strain BRFM310) TaxID=1353009 RepID=A0A1Y2IHK7_TRAC3|nr:hypothetical protein PYCCODRAFT_673575 [Trametes coccinea BRFM310]